MGLAQQARADNQSNTIRFDLVCHVLGRVVADPHPDFTGTGEDVRRWRYDLRYFVDLQAMRYCDDVACARRGTARIVSVSPDKIVFTNASTDKEVYWRRDRYWDSKLVDGELVSVTTGNCRIAKFSGFPPVVVRPAR
jgi:hypothetical protein